MVDVLVRAADAGDTYVAWRWIDDLDNPRARRLDTASVVAAIDVLDDSLLAPRAAETSEHARQRALSRGAFCTLERERALAVQLAQAQVLPADLVTEIRGKPPGSVRVRLTPSPRLARVPWETLAVDDSGDQRLLDIADIVYDPPASVRSERSVKPVPWETRAAQKAVFVIDPDTGTGELKPILRNDFEARKMFIDLVKASGIAGNVGKAVAEKVSRKSLSEWLKTSPSRFFYYGHVTSLPDEPGSASLHLSDGKNAGGWATPIGTHLPLSALDLLLGTLTPAVSPTSTSENGAAGHQLWPMPPRVAVIACEGGADFRSIETFGLVIAMLNAGAELVTTTRWTMPTDKTFWDHYDALKQTKVRPTTDFALTVNDAHTKSEPMAELAAWQRNQLNLWRKNGNVDITNTPLVWASLINTWAPEAAAAVG